MTTKASVSRILPRPAPRLRRPRWRWLPFLAVSWLLPATNAVAQDVVFSVSGTPVSRAVQTSQMAPVGDIVLTYQSGSSASGGSNAITVNYGLPISLPFSVFVDGTAGFAGSSISYTVTGSVVSIFLPSCGSGTCEGTIRISNVYLDVSDTSLTTLRATLTTSPASGYRIAPGETMPTVVGSVLPGLTSSGINGTSAVIRDNGVVSDPTWSLTIEENFVDAFSYTDFRSLRVQFSGIPPGVTLLTDGGAPPRLVENNVNVAEGFFDFGLVNSSRNSDWIGFESGSESGGVFSPTARSTVVVSGTLSVDSSAVFPLPTGQIRARVTLAHDEDNCPCEGLATFETELLPPGGVVVAEIVPAVPTVSVLVSADASEEGEIPGFFAVSRIGDTTEPLFVEYFVGGTATSGTDYAAIPRSVEIPAGEDFVFVGVDPVDDGIADPGETVVLTLANNGFYLIGTAPAAMLIEDSEPRPVVTLSAIDTEAREGPPANTGQWTFERTGDTGSPLAVGYTIGGTATNGSDYATLSGSVTIPAGAASVTLTLTPIADGLDEGDETVILTLASLASYTVGDPASGTVVIQDPAPIDLDLSGNAAGSGTASIALTLTVDSPPAADLTGRMRFQFVPDPLVAGGRDGDEFIWFEPGGMTETTFRIPAGATTAADPASIRVGTVAGTLTVFAETLAGEVLDQHQIIVGATAPQIDSVLIERSGSLFTVYVVGFSTALEVTSATFTFNGPNVQPLPPVNVTIPFRNWFDNPASEEFGSMFMYTQPVTVTSGDANNVTSVTVTLRNTRGDSNSRTGTVN